jgi:drug/metabolite transporter (DMT)-like permease
MTAVLLGLLAALCYGSSDFAAGAGGRRGSPAAVTAITQPFSLAAAGLAVVALPPRAATAGILLWGALSGVGSGVGTVALYRGLAVARMSVVAPVSAVVSAALPALTGFLTGEHLRPLAWIGIMIAIPAVALTSAQHTSDTGSRRAGIAAGLVAGSGFALMFIALDRAGTSAGAWPLVAGQAVATVIVMAWLIPARNRPRRGAWSVSWWPGTLAGVLAGIANLLYLAATGVGPLAVIAVVTALYPAATVLLARLGLHERWSSVQAAGLLISIAAVTAISLG